MKKIIFPVAAIAVFVVSAFIIKPKNEVVGHWIVKSGPNQDITIDFNKDGTFKTVIPSENFTVTGKYKMKENVMSITDTTCGKNYWASYKVKFITEDSVYTTVITDSCTGRRMTADKATLIRKK